MKNSFLFLLTFTTGACFGQVQTTYVNPFQTDSSYSLSEDSSAVSRNATVHQNKLFLFLGGTGSSSSKDYNALRLHSANLGFDFINLSYPNNVAAASLANSNDSFVFDNYRQELCFGTPVSPNVEVDSLHSIYIRALKLIQYLALTYPSENWGQYLLTPTSIDWSRIIVGGHSQGSGHACYLAKQYSVDRVLMFSGPNDYSDFFSSAANWLLQPGTTSISRHFSYLSLNDEVVPFFKQFVNISGLGMLVNDDSTLVDQLASPYENARCLYTTQSPGIVILNHNVPIKLSMINRNVWTYMLTSDIPTSLENEPAFNDMTLYPNPAKDMITLTSEHLQGKQPYSIYHVSGQFIKYELLVQQGPTYLIDISDLTPGIYFLNLGGLTKRIIKQ